MEFWSVFLTLAVVHLLAVVSPGPDFAVVTRNALAYSRRTGVLTGVGIGLGLLVHIGYSLVGVGAVIAHSIVAFNVIKYLGAAYLLYLGWQCLMSRPAKVLADDNVQMQQDLSPWRALANGFLVNALNPKAALYFVSLFAVIIPPHAPLGWMVLFVVYMIASAVLWFILVALVFSDSLLKRKILGVKHHIERAMGVALVGLGIKLAMSDLNK